MGQETTVINPVRFYRQPSEPPDAADGSTWVTDSDGSGNDTASRYVYNAEEARWELESAVGPSEPDSGTPVAGSTWRDTSNGTATQFDGSEFVNLGVTDHSNLQNVTESQHHTRYTDSEASDAAPVQDVLGDTGSALTRTVVTKKAGGGNGKAKFNVPSNCVAWGFTENSDNVSDFDSSDGGNYLYLKSIGSQIVIDERASPGEKTFEISFLTL